MSEVKAARANTTVPRRLVRSRIEALVRKTAMETRPDGLWQSVMTGGQAHVGLAVAARVLWGASEGDEVALARDLGRSGVATAGERDLVAVCLAIARIDAQLPTSPVRPGGLIYGRLAQVLRRALQGHGAGFLGLPWYPTIFDLVVHHWCFSLVRRWLPAPVVELLPAIGILLEGGARRTTLVQLWRAMAGLLGRRRREARLSSLHHALLMRQQPNGSWGWTVLGTSVALLALRVLSVDGNPSPAIARAVEYIGRLRQRFAAGAYVQGWAGSAVWDTAHVGEILLLAGGESTTIVPKIARRLTREVHADGLSGFDLGTAS